MSTKGHGSAYYFLQNHVDHQSDDCLPWPFAKTRGYGRFRHLGNYHYAHTYMCGLAHGEPPTPSHQPAHSCGRGDKGCINPRHLSWKTPSENQRDKDEHGTTYREGRRYVLTEQDVILIRCFNGCATHDQMAAQLGVTRRTVGAAADRRSWAHVL